MNKVWRLAGFLMASSILVGSRAAWSADSVCSGVTDAKSKSRQFFEGKILMANLLSLEAQGEARFHPTFAPPSSECIFEKFDAAGTPVEANYTPHEKGEHTLHWRFKAGGAQPREIVVIYDGMASFVAKKDVFFVVEERKPNIHYYAMFRDQPTYAVLKPIVTGILDGSSKPLASVNWPPGAKEPEIGAYDSARLK